MEDKQLIQVVIAQPTKAGWVESMGEFTPAEYVLLATRGIQSLGLSLKDTVKATNKAIYGKNKFMRAVHAHKVKIRRRIYGR